MKFYNALRCRAIAVATSPAALALGLAVPAFMVASLAILALATKERR